jgi:hypothetical protein
MCVYQTAMTANDTDTARKHRGRKLARPATFDRGPSRLLSGHELRCLVGPAKRGSGSCAVESEPVTAQFAALREVFTFHQG